MSEDLQMMDENKNQLVIYKNEINKISFNGLNKKDMDLFMSLVVSVMDKQDHDIVLDITDLKKLAQYRNVSLDVLSDYLETEFKRKVFALTVDIKVDGVFESWGLFYHYRVDKNENKMTLSVNPKVVSLFNNVGENFTKFDLLTYVSISSKYSKLLFTNLAQFKNKDTNSGWWIVKIDEFEKIFNPPETIKRNRYIDKIINPAIKGLEKYMDITCESIKDANKKGRPVTAYKFVFRSHTNRMTLENFEKQELLDMIMSEINLDKNEINTVKKILKDNDLSQKDIEKIVACYKNAKAENKMALLRDMLQNPDKYHEPKKSKKKDSFNDLEMSEYDKYDMDKIEKQILAN